MQFNTVCCGGTFDHFHKGHREFLKTALFYGEKIIIGLTTDEYVKNSKLKTSHFAKASRDRQNSKLIETYEIRKKEIEDFLSKENCLNRAEIVPISDLFGPTLSKDFKIDAILVAEMFLKNAELINQERAKSGLSPLEILIFKKIIKTEDGEPMSSSRIRAGEINREGKLYINPAWLKKNLYLTDSLRKILEKPLGEIIQNIQDYKMSDFPCVATVGDITTKAFNSLSLGQNISVVDFKIGRVKKFETLSELGFLGKEIPIGATNPAGQLTGDLFNAVLKAVAFLGKGERVVIKVDGEEDLSVLPLVLALPLGSVVFYGQRGEGLPAGRQGLVKVNISEEKKEAAYKLVSQFEAK